MAETTYRLRNDGKALRIISDASGRRWSIEPGQMVENVRLKPRTAMQLWKAQQMGSPLRFVDETSFPTEPDVQDFLSSELTEVLVPTGESGGGSTETTVAETKSSRSDAAVRLLAEIEEGKPYAKFHAEAKELVGPDDWPSGNPRKKDIVAILRGIAEEE